MKKIIIIIATIIVLTLGFTLFKQFSTKNTSVSTPSLNPQNEKVDIKASFTVVTGNITRNFSAEKYHNQSPDVYLEKSDPTIVHVTKAGTTWDDFFKTLPMKLTKECLITGDGETLCDGKGGSLKFYINDVETPDLLEKEIKDNDKILINFQYN